jgi:hypothetical protein
MNYKYISYALLLLILLSLVWLGYAINDYINLDSKSNTYDEDKTKLMKDIGLRVFLNLILAICWFFASKISNESSSEDSSISFTSSNDSSNHLYDYNKEQDKSHEIVFNL